jgi:hypothetical protein
LFWSLCVLDGKAEAPESVVVGFVFVSGFAFVPGVTLPPVFALFAPASGVVGVAL